jgi:hypothetical protein
MIVFYFAEEALRGKVGKVGARKGWGQVRKTNLLRGIASKRSDRLVCA